MGISNIFLNQNGYIGRDKYNTTNNLKYFIKSQLIYNNPKLFTTALTLTTRPGSHYTKFYNAIFNTLANDYQPFFYGVNESFYNNYYRLDFTANKMFDIKGNSLIIFITVNNLLNTKNQALIYYNNNYTKHYFQNYQQRTLYVGLQLRWNKIMKRVMENNSSKPTSAK